MKILHVIPSLHGGGAEKFCIDLCNEMSEQHDVTICSLFDVREDMFMAKALSPNVKLVTLNKKLGFDMSVFVKIFKLIRKKKYDVVNTHLRALAYSFLPIIFHQNKFFHTVHNMADKEARKSNRLFYKLVFRFFKVTPIAISKKVSDSIKLEYGRNYNVCIENGIKKPSPSLQYDEVKNELSQYKMNSATNVFLSIGRISAQKNYGMLVNVFNRLISEGDDVVLLIIGDDYTPEKQLLGELMRVTSKGIYFLGVKENIADYLLCADVFCLSSLYEGLPITLLEAFALGVPSICTPAGGIVDVIHDGENGLLSNDISKESFYSSIKRFLSFDERKRAELSKNATDSFDHFYDIKITSRRYIEMYTYYEYKACDEYLK